MAQFEVRPALRGDARAMAELFAAVAEERTGIATEPPVDVSERAELFAGSANGSLVAAIALYRKCGFVAEGRRARQYRRASGELWDSIVMGRVL